MSLSRKTLSYPSIDFLLSYLCRAVHSSSTYDRLLVWSRTIVPRWTIGNLRTTIFAINPSKNIAVALVNYILLQLLAAVHTKGICDCIIDNIANIPCWTDRHDCCAVLWLK